MGYKLVELHSGLSKDKITYYMAEVYSNEFHVCFRVFVNEDMYTSLLPFVNEDITDRIAFTYNRKTSSFNLIIK